MTRQRPDESPELQPADFPFAVFLYVVGLLLAAFKDITVLVVWSLLGLFVAYAVATFTARLRALREETHRNSAWIAEHRDTVERMHSRGSERTDV